MTECCDPAPYRRLFDEKGAESLLRRYRRKGLDPTAAKLVGYLTGRGVAGLTVLEVGGGIGEIQVELLKAGVGNTFNVELSDGYEDTAARLLDEEGLADRVERRIGDFVEEAPDMEPADIVVLNRVICCYPFMERMVDAATATTRSFLALAIPRDRWLGHVCVGFANAMNRIRGCGFQAFIHPVAEIEGRAAAAGLRSVFDRQSPVWRGVVFERL